MDCICHAGEYDFYYDICVDVNFGAMYKSVSDLTLSFVYDIKYRFMIGMTRLISLRDDTIYLDFWNVSNNEIAHCNTF